VIQDANAAIKTFGGTGTSQEKFATAVTNRSEAYLGMKQYQKATDCLDSPRYWQDDEYPPTSPVDEGTGRIGDDSDEESSDDEISRGRQRATYHRSFQSEVASQKRRVKNQQKTAGRPDYYGILSKSPCTKWFLKAGTTAVYKTCGGGDTQFNFNSDNEEPNRRKHYINRTSKEDDIKKAYRQRCLDLHPDKFSLRLSQFEQVLTSQGNPPLNVNQKTRIKDSVDAHYKMVQEAWEILSDSSKKRAYDQGYDKEDIENGRGMRSAYSDFSEWSF